MKYLRLIFLITMLFSIVGLHATSYSYNGINYTLNDNDLTASVTRGSYSGSVVIPSIVNNKYTVTSIGRNAFENCNSLTSVTLPNTITIIELGAFSFCSKLLSITIPNSVTVIDVDAFRYCTGMKSVTLGNGLKTIDRCAFFGCSSLTSITMPNSLTTIGEYTFYDCTSLANIVIPSSVISIGGGAFSHCGSISVNSKNPKYDSRNNSNAVIETATNTLVSGCNNTIIPNDIKVLGKYAFDGCTFESIDIPNSVITIGYAAFDDCKKLTSVKIPESVKIIDQLAFWNCTSLTSAIIGSDVISIYDGAFSGCSNLNKVTIKCTVPPTISSGTFTNRANATLYIPAGSKSAYNTSNYWKEFKEIVESVDFADAKVKAICVSNWDTDGDGELNEGEAAAVNDLGLVFKGNTEIISFNELRFFTGLKSIGDYQFSGCSNLKEIMLPPNISSIEKGAFGSTGFERIDISEGITSIGKEAFARCNNLIRVSLPSTIKTIGNYAFAWSDNRLSVIFSSATPPTLKIGSFYSTYEKSVAYVPVGSKAAYEESQYFNSDFDKIIEINTELLPLLPQTLTSNIPSTKTYGDATFALPNITDEGVAITWTMTNTKVMSISNNILTIKNAGTAVITASNDGSSDYLPFSREFTLNVSKAPLTITANDKTKIKGEENPELTIIYEGFKYSDDASNLITRPTITTTATIDSPSGIYPIIVSGATSDNYEITHINGTLSVISPIITFADAIVKAICVANWDTNGDGELSEEEAATVTSFGTAFTGNTSITKFGEIRYFTGLGRIDDSAFLGCTGLTSIEIPEGILSIGMAAFQDCKNLQSVTLPSKLNSIGSSAFQGCEKLASMDIPLGTTRIDGAAFVGCSGLTSMSIPQSITTIGEGAFQECTGLTSITIPASVTSIGNYAFSDCARLASVTIYAPELTDYGRDTFLQNADDRTIYVFNNSLSAYKSGWSQYADDIKPITSIALADNSDNSGLIDAANDNDLIVTLQGSTLYKDGAWNTLCMPFELVLEGSPLDGAKVKKLTASTSNLTDGTLTLNFEDETTTMAAGTPYLIKWDKAEDYDADDPDSRDLKNPVFAGVTIDKTMHDVNTSDDKVTFKGNYDARIFDAENKSILLVGGDNLYWPLADASIKAFRAYFQLNDIRNAVREIKLNFDDETTSMHNAQCTMHNEAGAWYTIDGRELDKQPTMKGMYIHNCKKVVIR